MLLRYWIYDTVNKLAKLRDVDQKSTTIASRVKVGLYII